MEINENYSKQQDVNATVLETNHYESDADFNRAIMAYQFFYPSVYSLDSWDVNNTGIEFTPLSWEDNIGFWEELAKVVNTEPVYEPYCAMYNELAALGIEKGKSFDPDARMKAILETAAKTANANMRLQYFAERKPDHLLWNDRRWEVAAMSHDNPATAPNYTDRYIREKWLNNALWGTTPLNRMGGAGYLYCLSTADNSGAPLQGSNSYKLSIPCPVPAQLFWTVTLYDVRTGSEILTEEIRAVLHPLLGQDVNSGSCVELYFGPTPVVGKESCCIRTTPGESWFAYFRIYGPGSNSFDGRWKLGDFEKLKIA